MTDFRASGHAVLIEDTRQLVEEFHRAAKPRARWMVGTEYEKVAVDAKTGRAVPFTGPRGIERLLTLLAERFGWEPREESGAVIALAREGQSITLEPGGQIELAGRPCADLHATREEVDTHVRELVAVGRELGISFLGLGCHPLSTLDEIAWVPKQRYRIMREYMTRVGKLGHRMMKQTATVQANIDFSDERDAMRKLRVGMGIAPIVNAIFANSPLVDGDLSGHLSFRGHVWTDTDRTRCGLLPFAFRDDAGFHDYVDWALDVPLYFILRDGRYVTDVTGIPFRRFLSEGFGGARATLDDWNLHLTTLFPEVRLKGFIEFRSADSQPPGRVVALPALVKGVFYDADCQEAGLDVVKRWSVDQVRELYDDVTRGALAARMKGVRVVELARELLEIAAEGLRRQQARNEAGQDERIYLEPVIEQVAGGRTLADDLSRQWSGPWERAVEPLLTATAIGI
ncbi:MAG TPA: glutamate--cysteine ligase [Candidatus Eisenbacteria bacterium]|nr:glutamate--cysteine ligase [Candidatus Eisenbacteria bacterium]